MLYSSLLILIYTTTAASCVLDAGSVVVVVPMEIEAVAVAVVVDVVVNVVVVVVVVGVEIAVAAAGACIAYEDCTSLAFILFFCNFLYQLTGQVTCHWERTKGK